MPIAQFMKKKVVILLLILLTILLSISLTSCKSIHVNHHSADSYFPEGLWDEFE